MGELLELGIDPAVARRVWHRSRIAGKRVLYVDDERLMRLSVARLLRRAGAVCIGAGTHEEAVAMLSIEPVLDVAILDFEMPDGDVSRLVQHLRSKRPRLQLVGTSGVDYRCEFAARGVDEFLPKPWALDDLIRAADWTGAH